MEIIKPPFWEAIIKQSPRNAELFELERESSKVYFASDEKEVVKIGKSINPEKRLIAIQKECQTQLKILKIFNGGYLLEKFLHIHFASIRISGEWFVYGDEIKSFLKEHEGVI